MIGLMCKRALQKRLYSAKETYHFIDPTNRSHTISYIHVFIAILRAYRVSESIMYMYFLTPRYIFVTQRRLAWSRPKMETLHSKRHKLPVCWMLDVSIATVLNVKRDSAYITVTHK